MTTEEIGEELEMKLLCQLGLHRWREGPTRRTCFRCGKRQYWNFKVMTRRQIQKDELDDDDPGTEGAWKDGNS